MTTPLFTTLAEWLAWQEQLHPRSIDLQLERVQEVAKRMNLTAPRHPVITVGGTNGKGSCVAFLEAMLSAGGYRVGAYTSPHLRQYNERIRLAGKNIDDSALCRAFERIDQARGDSTLTYFEFGTLAALLLFTEACVDVAVLEVGLGGRLDAVNILDADVAVITSIAIDHVQWLGPDRDSIGYEKAGIFRPRRPAVCADPAPPARLLEHAQAIGAVLYRVGVDYDFHRNASGWAWRGRTRQLSDLPLPGLAGTHQLRNAAAALTALDLLAERLPLTPQALRQGLREVAVPARFQVMPGSVEWILDVAHNPHGAAALADCLRQRPCTGRTRVVFAMQPQKDAAAVIAALSPAVDDWYMAALTDCASHPSAQLVALLADLGSAGPARPFASVAAACETALNEAAAGDRIVVCGSFYTVAAALAANPGGVLSA